MKVTVLKKLSCTWIFLLLIVGCSFSGPSTPYPTETISSSPTIAASPSATATETPELVYLHLTEAADQLSKEPLRQMLSDLATTSGLEFSEGISSDPIPTGASVIVTTAEATAVQQLLSERSEAFIVAIGLQGIQETERLLVLGPSGLPFDRAAFVAGYTGAMLIPDHRTGMVAYAGDSQREQRTTAYRFGQEYYCGLCRSAYPPFVDYPLFVELTETASQTDLANAIAELRQGAAQSILLPPIAADSELWGGLESDEIILISPIQPPAGVDAVDLVVRPAPELAIQENWAGIIEGTFSTSIDIPITMSALNDDQISQARLRLVDEIILDINSGFIRVGNRLGE